MASMPDHEPNSALRDQLRLEEAREAERIAQARTQAFERWHLYLEQRRREKAAERKSA